MENRLKVPGIDAALTALEEEIEFFQTRVNEDVYNSSLRESSQQMLLGIVYSHMKLTELKETYNNSRKKELESELNK